MSILWKIETDELFAFGKRRMLVEDRTSGKPNNS